jgi:CBS domain-containing protein
MKCPSCHQENIEGADDCSYCGAALYGLRINTVDGPDFIHRPLADMRKRPVHSVQPNDPVAMAVRIMQREDVNCVFVKDDAKVVGIITGWDILQKVAGPSEDLVAVTCDKIMTRSPYSLEEGDSIALALNAMASGGFRHLPISDDGQPSGIITASDLFRYISPHLV